MDDRDRAPTTAAAGETALLRARAAAATRMIWVRTRNVFDRREEEGIDPTLNRPPVRATDGSDGIANWPAKHPPGTQLGATRDGRRG